MGHRVTASRLLIAMLGLPTLLGGPAVSQEPAGPETAVATTDTFAISIGEALALLNEHSARQVLEELVLEALVLQEAHAEGVAVPDEDSLLVEYADFLREVAAARGFDDRGAPLSDLVSAANIEGYFADAGLSLEAVLRRIRVVTAARGVLTMRTQLSDEDLDAEMARVRPLVVSPEQRKIGLFVRDAETEAAELAGELRSEVETISASLPPNTALRDVLQGRLRPWDQDVFWAAPGPGVDAGPLVAAAFGMPDVGSVSEPVALDGRFVVLVVLRVIHATDAVPGAAGMTAEELAAAQATVEARVRQAARDYLMSERVEAMLPGWLARLRSQGNVEILWGGPEGAPAAP